MGTNSASALMLSGDSMDKLMRIADLMASGKCTVPQHLQKSPGDCLAVAMQAMQWNMNPFAVAQKTHISQSGALGYEAQLINAVIVGCGALRGQPEFTFLGDWSKILGKVEEKKNDNGKKYYVANWQKKDEEGLGVIVTARLAGESEPRQIQVMLSQCYPRFSTQWATDPQQQITYVGVRKFGRRYAPGAILGVYTPEELEESLPRNMGTAEVVSAWTPEQLDAAEKAASKGAKAYVSFWKSLGADMQKKLAGTPEHEAFKDQAQRADTVRTIDTPTPPPVATPAPNPDTGEIVTTVADVRAKLEASKNEDALYVAMDWLDVVPEVEREAARPELEALFKTRLTAIRGELAA
jgi:hypothetical protein